VASFEAFFDPRWLWVQYTATLFKVYSISDDLDFLVAKSPDPPPEKVDELYTRLQEVLRASGTAWANKRLQDEAAGQPRGGKAPL
jgi:hypothetical protein